MSKPLIILLLMAGFSGWTYWLSLKMHETSDKVRGKPSTTEWHAMWVIQTKIVGSCFHKYENVYITGTYILQSRAWEDFNDPYRPLYFMLGSTYSAAMNIKRALF